MKRLGIFLDLANLYLSVNENFKTEENKYPRIDFRKYYHFFDEFGEVTVAIGYGALLKGANIDNFLAHLRLTGFTPKYKDLKEYHNRGKFRRKADWDVGIAIDCIKHMDDYDVCILGSGDGDFVPLVEYLIEKGKQVFIFASEISRDLKEAGTTFFEVTNSILQEKVNEFLETKLVD